jgi:hypothetical protein
LEGLAILGPFCLLPNGIFYVHLVHFVVIGYIFNRFGGMLYQEKFGNPAEKVGIV